MPVYINLFDCFFSQAGQTRTFLLEEGFFGDCGKINFAGMNLTIYGIIHVGLEAWYEFLKVGNFCSGAEIKNATLS